MGKQPKINEDMTPWVDKISDVEFIIMLSEKSNSDIDRDMQQAPTPRLLWALSQV
jgi:hypothetical protein